jgi:hypothetical protein
MNCVRLLLFSGPLSRLIKILVGLIFRLPFGKTFLHPIPNIVTRCFRLGKGDEWLIVLRQKNAERRESTPGTEVAVGSLCLDPVAPPLERGPNYTETLASMDIGFQLPPPDSGPRMIRF